MNHTSPREPLDRPRHHGPPVQLVGLRTSGVDARSIDLLVSVDPDVDVQRVVRAVRDALDLLAVELRGDRQRRTP